MKSLPTTWSPSPCSRSSLPQTTTRPPPPSPSLSGLPRRVRRLTDRRRRLPTFRRYTLGALGVLLYHWRLWTRRKVVSSSSSAITADTRVLVPNPPVRTAFLQGQLPLGGYHLTSDGFRRRMRCLTMTPVVARHPEDGPDPHISDRSAYLTESAGPDSASRPPSVPSHQRNGVASMTTGIYASFVAPGTLVK